MVPVEEFPADVMTLTELVQQYRLLLPPRDMRSRKLMEERITAWGIDDFQRDRRVAAETYDTSTSGMQLRQELATGRWDRRVLVVPSDVALAFKDGMEFGGLYADRFKWVPIVHDTGGGRLEILPHDVHLTVRRDARRRDQGVEEIVQAVVAAVTELEALPDGRPGLSGGRPVAAPRL